ncbi:hypothetical protein O3M35_007689 [Rhynocoris fuscipes]|uniref:Uncharacterized protein n=1 Tax=Rhynocoris fuscipes TaxID=488301 RepID=A0AAW1DBV7_9HEMI
MEEYEDVRRAKQSFIQCGIEGLFIANELYIFRHYNSFKYGQDWHILNHTGLKLWNARDFTKVTFCRGKKVLVIIEDKEQNPLIILSNPLECTQKIEVYCPPGGYLGKVKKQFSFLRGIYNIINPLGALLYKLKERGNPFGFNKKYKIVSPILGEIGSIELERNHVEIDSAHHALRLRFPPHLDFNSKVLLIGGTFLIGAWQIKPLRTISEDTLCK